MPHQRAFLGTTEPSVDHQFEFHYDNTQLEYDARRRNFSGLDGLDGSILKQSVARFIYSQRLLICYDNRKDLRPTVFLNSSDWMRDVVKTELPNERAV